ncbi:protein translocase subunit SecD, partial [Lysobacter sp. 2RAB21]
SKSIKVEDGNLMVRLNDTDQQTKASDLLRPQLGSDYVVALSLAPTVPNWLASLGAKPMPRGLDLQGGVHFVMQVDQAAALDKRLEAYVEDVRATLRDNSVPYT